jgi:hypothetical protein
MPVSEFAFVIDSSDRKVTTFNEGSPVIMSILPDINGQLERKAKETFGAKAKFITRVKSRSGTIRYFQKRGMKVVKRAGDFYLEGDDKRMLVWASIDVPQEYIVRQNGGTLGAVDLTDLENTNE